MNKLVRTCAAVGLFAPALAMTVGASETIWIEAERDNTLIEDPAGALSNGAGPYFFAGRISQGTIRRGVIAFDLEPGIPAGAEILSARLVLHMSQTSGGPARVSLHRLDAAWGEGTSSATGGTGAPSSAGDATWLHTFYDSGYWALAGGDFHASSASAIVDQVGTYEFGSTPEMVGDLQSWLAAASENHGWLLRGDESQRTTSKRFDSRENPTAALRPILIVEFNAAGGDDEVDDEDGDESAD